MADTSNLSNYLKDVADAIRAKKGTTDPIPAANFDIEIASIPTGGGRVGDVKLFETVEEMQVDTTAKDGDLAVVYREEIQNMTADTQTQYITFPETVTLPEAFTDSFYGMLRAVDESVMFDGQVMLDQSMFNFNGYSETGMIRVGYQSEDGITYTRQEFMGDSGDLTNPVDLGTVVKYEPMEPWNDTLGYFMQIGGNVFEGLYEYASYIDENYIQLIGMGDITFNDDNTMTVHKSSSYVYNSQVLYDLCTKIKTDTGINGLTLMTGEDGNIYLYTICKSSDISSTYSYALELYIDDNGTHVYPSIPESTYGSGYDSVVYFKVNLENNTYEQLDLLNLKVVYWKSKTTGNTIERYISDTILAKTVPVLMGTSGDSFSIDSFSNLPYVYQYSSDLGMYEQLDSYTGEEISQYLVKTDYRYADTQLTLSKSNELLPGIIGYGKNGVITGDESIYNNLNIEFILSTYYGFTKGVHGNYVGYEDNSEWIFGESKDTFPTGKLIYVTCDNAVAPYVGVKVDMTEFVSVDNYADILRSLGKGEYVDTTSCARGDTGKYIAFIASLDDYIFVLNTETNTIDYEINSIDSYITYKNKIYYIPNANKNQLYVLDLTTLENTLVTNFPTTTFGTSSVTHTYKTFNEGGYILLSTKTITSDKTKISQAYQVYDMKLEQLSPITRIQSTNCNQARNFSGIVWTQNSVICDVLQNISGQNNLAHTIVRYDFGNDTWSTIISNSDSGIPDSSSDYRGYEFNNYVYFSSYRFLLTSSGTRENVTYESGAVRNINYTKDNKPMLESRNSWYNVIGLDVSGTVVSSIILDETNPIYIDGHKRCLDDNEANSISVTESIFTTDENGDIWVEQCSGNCSGKTKIQPINITNSANYTHVVVNANTEDIRLLTLGIKSKLSTDEYNECVDLTEQVLGEDVSL